MALPVRSSMPLCCNFNRPCRRFVVLDRSRVWERERCLCLDLVGGEGSVLFVRGMRFSAFSQSLGRLRDPHGLKSKGCFSLLSLYPDHDFHRTVVGASRRSRLIHFCYILYTSVCSSFPVFSDECAAESAAVFWNAFGCERLFGLLYYWCCWNEYENNILNLSNLI